MTDTPSLKNRVDMKERILDAAMESFATTGFEGTSLRDIAKKLGINHQNITHHFGPKLGLWRAVIDRGVKEIISRLSAYEFTDDKKQARENLKEHIFNEVESIADNAALLQIFCSEGMRGSSRYEEYILPNLIAGEGQAKRIFEHAMSLGIIKEASVEDLLFVLKGATYYRSIVGYESSKITGRTLETAEMRRLHADIIIKIFFNPE